MGINQLPTDVQSFAARLIRRKARQLATHDNITPSDRDDIAQDLWLHLVENLPKFDPDKGNIFAFIVTVVERETAAIWRKYRAEKRDTCRCSSLNQSVRAHDGTRVELASTITEDAPHPRLGQRGRHFEHAVDIAHDVTATLAQLPPDLRDLCERLKTQSISEIARDTGIPRTTLNSRIRALRAHFEEAGLREYL